MSHNKHRNDNNSIFGQPEIEKLYNGRYRMTFRCLRDDNNTGWYYANAADIFANFGTLSDTPYAKQGKAVTAPTGSTWPDMKLIRHGWEFVPQQPVPFLTFVYETITDTYTKDRADKIDFDLNGLRRVTRTLIASEDANYAKVVGTDSLAHTALGYGEETLYLASVSEDAKSDGEGGFTRIQEVWLEPGVIREAIGLNSDGTKEVSITSWYDKPTPSGIITDTVEENVEGFNVWTVSAVQSLSGGDPTDGTALSYQVKAQFEKPGVATPVKNVTSYAGGDVAFLDVELSPPITELVTATLNVSYQTSSTLPTPSATIWNPTEWAVLEANWLRGDRAGSVDSEVPRSRYEGLRGYRASALPSATVNVDAAGVARLNCVFSEFAFNTTVGFITISGGPEDPSGNTYVINRPTLDPAFTGEDGTQYYRYTEVVATIP